MINLKNKNLTKVSLFKNNFASLGLISINWPSSNSRRRQCATNWTKYIIHNQVAGAVGDGYQVTDTREQKELKESLYSKLIKQFLNNKH